MSTSTISSTDQLEQLDIKLASLGGLDLKSVRQLVTAIASIVTFLGATRLGSNVGLTGNERLVSLIVAGVVIAAFLIGQSIHHAAIEHGNAAVKAAAIRAATSTLTPVVIDSPPDAQTEAADAALPVVAAAPDPVTEPDIAVPQPPEVGADLPVETVSTSLPTA